jgi:hypothetical protein
MLQTRKGTDVRLFQQWLQSFRMKPSPMSAHPIFNLALPFTSKRRSFSEFGLGLVPAIAKHVRTRWAASEDHVLHTPPSARSTVKNGSSFLVIMRSSLMTPPSSQSKFCDEGLSSCDNTIRIMETRRALISYTVSGQ